MILIIPIIIIIGVIAGVYKIMVSVTPQQRISPVGLTLLKKLEGGCQLKAFKDAAGWSIGWGHYLGTGDFSTLSITQAQADKYLIDDLADVEKGIHRLIPFTLPQDKFDALVSLGYNTGAFAHSEPLGLIGLLISQDWQAAARHISIHWLGDNAGHSGILMGRRFVEAIWFRDGIKAANKALDDVNKGKVISL